jgi:hypothetical protein
MNEKASRSHTLFRMVSMQVLISTIQMWDEPLGFVVLVFGRAISTSGFLLISHCGGQLSGNCDVSWIPRGFFNPPALYPLPSLSAPPASRASFTSRARMDTMTAAWMVYDGGTVGLATTCTRSLQPCPCHQAGGQGIGDTRIKA